LKAERHSPERGEVDETLSAAIEAEGVETAPTGGSQIASDGSSVWVWFAKAFLNNLISGRGEAVFPKRQFLYKTVTEGLRRHSPTLKMRST
jgi:hypothetical protein